MTTDQKLADAGIDWLTFTSVDDDTTLKLASVKNRLLKEQMFDGVLPKKWGSMGYSGQNWGPMKLGVRNGNEAILILSGNICSNSACWMEIDPSRVRRADLQVTIGLEKRQPEYAHHLYRALPHLTEFSRYVKVVKYISSPTGDTLYIGKRGRSHLLRIYDKSLDLGYKKLGFAWRYEMEYRGDAAQQVVRRLNEKEDRRSYILGQVTAELKKRGIRSSFGAGSTIDAIEVSAKITTAETKMDWLAKCVAPVVVQLLNLGYEEEIMNSLKLKHIYDRRKANGPE